MLCPEENQSQSVYFPCETGFSMCEYPGFSVRVDTHFQYESRCYLLHFLTFL